jgi:hypothetical protein
MKFSTNRPYANPEAAARKLIALCDSSAPTALSLEQTDLSGVYGRPATL